MDLSLSASLFEGIGIGLVFGIVIGTTWEHAFEMVTDAIEERRMIEHRETSRLERFRVLATGNRMAILLGFTCIVMVCVGAFQVYSYSHMRNFMQCQATYNQQSSEARQARLKASNRENNSFYAWLQTLPPLLDRRSGSQPDPDQVKDFRDTLDGAIRTHILNIQSQKDNPYPPDPADTCGEY